MKYICSLLVNSQILRIWLLTSENYYFTCRDNLWRRAININWKFRMSTLYYFDFCGTPRFSAPVLLWIDPFSCGLASHRLRLACTASSFSSSRGTPEIQSRDPSYQILGTAPCKNPLCPDHVRTFLASPLEDVVCGRRHDRTVSHGLNAITCSEYAYL